MATLYRSGYTLAGSRVRVSYLRDGVERERPWPHPVGAEGVP
jgi:hypothetical protein